MLSNVESSSKGRRSHVLKLDFFIFCCDDIKAHVSLMTFKRVSYFILNISHTYKKSVVLWYLFFGRKSPKVDLDNL